MSTQPLPPPEERLTQQERANFLEEFIRRVTEEMDALMEGRNFDAEIKSLKFRIGLLERGESADFRERIRALREELAHVEGEYALLRPKLERLEQERRFYRSQTSGF